MPSECYPMSILPHVTRLYSEYLAMESDRGPLSAWYAVPPASTAWMGQDVSVAHTGRLADLLVAQNQSFAASPAVFANIELLRSGARAVVTGQQVGLFGGPLLTLMKAATAIARAAQATRATGVPHVPVFWLATEDHDLAEIDQAHLLSKHAVETLRLGLTSTGGEVGSIVLGAGVTPLLEQVSELLSYAPICDLLVDCYQPGATLGGAFAKLISALFAEHGLIVIDAAGREFHALGAPALRAAVERAPELEKALLARTAELEAGGFHAQVLVKPSASLLFLLDAETGRREAMRRTGENWKAGSRTLSPSDLLEILDSEPERISPNALLRPVFQDTILPVAAYIGGPAEIAYFAQSAVIHQSILGRLTPVLPRFSATILEPAIATVMQKHEATLDQVFEAKTGEQMAQRLGARAMPIEGKRKLAAVGNAMDAELSALTGYLATLDESLGRSAEVSARKMRYQMNRLRRMAATFEVQKEASLRKHADAMMLHLFPDGHPQERLLAGIWFLAQSPDLIGLLVAEAADMCPGHSVLRI